MWAINGKIRSIGLVLEHFGKNINTNALRFPSVIAMQGANHQLEELLLVKRHSNTNNSEVAPKASVHGSGGVIGATCRWGDFGGCGALPITILALIIVLPRGSPTSDYQY